MKSFFRFIAHIVFRERQFCNKNLIKFASTTSVKNKNILELGSGKKIRNNYPYSARKFFHSSNTFITSDIVPSYGHKFLDATKIRYRNKFDIILCMNVLEHVFEFSKVLRNMHKSLKSSGIAVIFVPCFYPLHDEPNDYWRFTEHSLRKLLKDFKSVKIKHLGIRQYPFAYYVEARK